jgi:hypothetical protein
MNWEAVGAIGEVIGAFGVIASLAYLGIQIRHSTAQMGEHSRALRIAAIDQVAASFSRFRDPLIRDPELARLWLKGTRDYDSLDEVEKIRCGRLFQELFFAHQNTYSRYLEAASSEAAWLDHRDAIAANLRLPGIRTWWARTRSIYADDFEEIVEDLLRAEAATGSDSTASSGTPTPVSESIN